MGRILKHRHRVWAVAVVASMFVATASSRAQEDQAAEDGDAPANQTSPTPDAGGEAAEAEGGGEPGELTLAPTVIEAVSQKGKYGLDGLYQPGRTSFPLGGTLTRPEEVPFTFSVIDEDLFTDINPTKLDAVAQFVPGVHQGNQVSNVAEVFVSRGFQLGRDNILVNGMQRADSFSVTPTELVSEVEFYRGPSSILNGQTPPGGAANIVTKKPLAESFARLTGTVGQFETFEGAIDLNVSGMKLFGMDGAFRLNVAAKASNTFRNHIDREFLLIAPVWTLNISDRTTVTFELNYSNLTTPDDRGLPLPSLLQTTSATATTTDEEAEQFDESDFILGTTDVENEQEQLRLMLDASHDWTDRLTTNFQVSYGETKRSFFTIVPARGTFNPATREVNTADFGDLDEFESLNARLDTTFEFDTGPLTHRGIVGIEYRYWEQVELKDVFTASPDPILNVDNPDPDRPFSPLGPGDGLENEEESFEGFFQDAIEVNRGVFEGVRVIGGGRVVNYRTFGRFDGNRDGLEFVPRVGVGYTPPMLDWLMVFGNYSESFNPQGDAEPQEGEQWEAGLKATFLDDRLTASLVWFDLKNTNVPVTNLGVTEFIGEQENTGVELEVVGELLPNLQIYGQYAYHDSEILVDDDPNRIGNELQITPTHSGSVWLRYDLPMFSSPLVKNASDRLTLAGGLVYVGDRYATENNQIELTSYVRLDLMARYELAENTSFQLNLQNVTDTRYFTGGNIDSNFTGSVTPGQPLTVTASITHEF